MSPQRRSPVFFPALLKTMLAAAAACLRVYGHTGDLYGYRIGR